MAKQTKRQRKFQASGGVKKRIEKGTITKHGKLKQRRSDKHNAPTLSTPNNASTQQQRQQDDLTGPHNLGDMDLDTFFAQFSNDQSKADNEEDQEDVVSTSSNSGGGEFSLSEQDHSKNHDSDASHSDSDDDDDDDNLEQAEAAMKREMAQLQAQDPEFHQFLQTNEQSLLEFGHDNDEELDGGRDSSDDDESNNGDDQRGKEENEPHKADASKNGTELTSDLLTKLATSAIQNNSIKNLKKLMGAYKSACYLSNQQEEADQAKKLPYYFEDSQIYDTLMVTCFNKLDTVFWYHLFGTDNDDNDPVDKDKPLNPNKLERSPHWNDLKGILSTFFRSTLHVMMEAKEPELLAFVLKRLSNFVRFLTPFPKLAENMVKTLVALWSAPLDTSPAYQVVRLQAFFRIRQLVLSQPFPFIETILKKTYLAYAKRAKFGATFQSPALVTLTFMGNCLVELYSLDYDSSYQHGFVYIRQLALLLRGALQKKTKESMQQVYCWQFVHCLKVWVSILAAAAPAPDGAPMRSLIYPLTEIILGTVRMAPSPLRHLPLRFHCVRQLQQLAAASETFIPTTSILLDCLDHKEWYMAPKKSKRGSNAVQMNLMLKLAKDDALRTHEQLEAAIREVFLLLNREVELYRFSAGFTEFSARVVARLRVFSKQSRNPRWRAYAKACMDVCEKYSAYCVSGRSKLAEAPRDVQQLECLRPANEKSMRERHKASIEKEQKALQDSLPASSLSSQKGKKRVLNDDKDSGEHNDKDTKQAKPQAKKKKASKKMNQSNKPSAAALQARMMDETQVLKVQDEVQTGIDWSDDDDE